MAELSYTLLRLLPKNTLSRAVGAACRANAPRPVVRAVIRAFARKYGVEDHVLASLAETFPGIDWERNGTYFFSRVVQHGRRRALP